MDEKEQMVQEMIEELSELLVDGEAFTISRLGLSVAVYVENITSRVAARGVVDTVKLFASRIKGGEE